jgi:hypothetical protein
VKWQWVGEFNFRALGGKRRHRRWFIAYGDNQYLDPYRIKVDIVANSRVNGKVKQEIIATLGTIDATWLESFWVGTPPELRIEKWELRSLQNRTAFWDGVLHRMSQIGDNRLSKDERKATRQSIHKVVPWVMEPERKRLALLEAQANYDELKHMHEWSEQSIARLNHTIKTATEQLKEDQARSAEFANGLLHAGVEIAKLPK